MLGQSKVHSSRWLYIIYVQMMIWSYGQGAYSDVLPDIRNAIMVSLFYYVIVHITHCLQYKSDVCI